MKQLQVLKRTIRAWIMNKTVQQYSFNTFWMITARCSWIISAFTVGIFVTRKLGPERLGVLSYSMAWISMFTIILDLGVSGIIQRDLVKYPEKKDHLLGNFAMFKIVQTGIMLLSAGTVLFFSGQSAEVIKLILILMAGYLTSFSTSLRTYFAAVVQNKYEAFSQIISCFIYNTIRLCAVIFDWPLVIYAVAESVLLMSYHIPLIYFYKKTGNLFRTWTFRMKEVFSLFLPAIPLSFAGIFSTIYSRTDILMLKYFNNFENIGFYTLASRFTLNLALFCGLLGGVFSTAVSSSKRHSEKEYRKQLHRFYFLLFWIMVPFLPLFIVAAPYLFEFLYGKTFLTAAAIFSIYIYSLPCTGLLNAYYWHCTIENKLILLVISNGLGALINVLANWYMIPQMGTLGAAWSSVISMPAGLMLTLLCTNNGRAFLRIILRSLFTLPSFRLNHSGT